MGLVKHQRRVAIIGLPNSGKTVLLTSLLWHLEQLSDDLSTALAFRSIVSLWMRKREQ